MTIANNTDLIKKKKNRSYPSPKKDNFVRRWMLINLIMVIILQPISNNHILYHKYEQFSFVHYTSIKLKNNKKLVCTYM